MNELNDTQLERIMLWYSCFNRGRTHSILQLLWSMSVDVGGVWKDKELHVLWASNSNACECRKMVWNCVC